MKGSRMEKGYTTAGFLKYLEDVSDRGVGDIELSRLNEAANIRDRIAGEIQDWVRLNAEAMYAGWVLARRKLERSVAAIAEGIE